MDFTKNLASERAAAKKKSQPNYHPWNGSWCRGRGAPITHVQRSHKLKVAIRQPDARALSRASDLASESF